MMPNTITIRRPDDWHVHLRDGDMLATVLPFTAAQFRRAIIMPNLVPPVTTPDAASAYRRRIMAALPAGSDFEPLMTCYLTDATDPDELARGHAEGLFVAAKLYPAGATTNAYHGVTDLSRIDAVLARMERIGMPLLSKGESAGWKRQLPHPTHQGRGAIPGAAGSSPASLGNNGVFSAVAIAAHASMSHDR